MDTTTDRATVYADLYAAAEDERERLTAELARRADTAPQHVLDVLATDARAYGRVAEYLAERAAREGVAVDLG